jgi:hypothetical protein
VSAECVYDGKPAVGIDLCHASHPVCAEHVLGHQLAPLEVAEPKPQKRAPSRAASTNEIRVKP